ncbi:MAG: SdrD B-like domain-containing protein, partial [Anaerolineae bacterium]
GVTVNLIDPRDGRLIESQVTGAAGDYLFEMLSNQYYIVQVDESTLPSGFSNTNHEVGDFNSSYVNDVCAGDCLQRDGATYDRIYYIDLDVDQHYRAADFGYAPGDATKAVIGDYVWSDADADGSQERGEPGIGGVTLQLLADDDGDGSFTDVVATTTTADDGSYLFTNVDPGTYVVKVTDGNFDSGAALNGYTVTSGPQSPGANVTAAIDVAAGDAYLAADFGYDKPGLGRIGNYVWYDVDNDGEQDPGEVGAANVTLDLYLDSDGDGEIDGGEAVIATEVTDADGGYSFVGLELDEHYLVSVSDRNGVLTALDITTYWGDDAICALGPSLPDDHPSCDPLDLDRYNDPVPVHLTSTTSPWIWADFGYNGDGTIGDLVWYDWFENGVQDPGEIGVADVELKLLNGDGSDYDRNLRLQHVQPYILQTGSGGRYLFTGLAASDYQVQMTLPSGYSLSSGTPENPHDSDGITLAVSQSYPDADFGLVRTQAYTIGDTVWYDANADGIEDAGESGIPDVSLALYEDSDGDGILDATEPPLGEVTTDENGYYAFYGAVDGGHYVVAVTDENGVLADYEQTAGLDPWALTISGASRDDIDFGYVRSSETGSIGDTVWYDTDGDGAEDATERGIANVVVELYEDTNGNDSYDEGTDLLLDTSYTDADGGYLFTELPAGSYFVQVDSGSFSAGEPLEGLSSTTGGEMHGVVALSEGQDYLLADFGYRGSGYTIGDYVWSDANDDGVQDQGEVGIGGVTVQLLDNNDTVISTTVTLPGGWYLFSGLSAGSYKVRVSNSNFDAGGGLEGYSVTSGPQSEGANTSSAVEFADDDDPANDTILSVDFGYYTAGLGSIGDYVWLDKDLDGDQDADEPGLIGVTLDLIHDLDGDGILDAGEPVLATTVTAEDGDYRNYLFTGLDLDDGDGDFDYLVQVTDRDNVLAGLSPTTGTVNPRSVALSSVITTVLDADFGYDDPELGDFVWHDVDKDGIQDSGESGIENVRVDLYHDVDGDGVLDAGQDSLMRTTTTNVNGYYYFFGLPFDDYIIKLADSNFAPGGMLEGFDATTQNAGADDAVDSDGHPTTHEIATTPMTAKDFTLDFGFHAASYTIGDLVWEDGDKDGLKGGSEFGLDGVTLVLYRDLDGDGVLDPEDGVLGRTTTSGGGAYAFPDLPNGDYIVQVTDENDVLDGYTQTAGGDPQPVTLSDSDDLTVDFGYWRNGGGGDDPTSVLLRSLSAGRGVGIHAMSLVLVLAVFLVVVMAVTPCAVRRAAERRR